MQGFFSKLSSIFTKLSDKNHVTEIDRERYVEDLLLLDMSFSVVERLINGVDAANTKPLDTLKGSMKQILVSAPLIEPKCGILMIGINGSGKTTTIAKLGKWYVDHGYSVIVGAGDTYRAAAIEQLSILSNRIGMDIVKAMPGVDPASVIHDAVMAYKHRAKDVIMGDTAGRLHTNVNLVNELKKIKSVMTKAMTGDRMVTYLIIDATIGKNSFQQAKLFKENIGIDGIIITKLDGTAKGGIIFTICDELRIPVVAIGNGESMDDFMLFDKDTFVEELFK